MAMHASRYLESIYLIYLLYLDWIHFIYILMHFIAFHSSFPVLQFHFSPKFFWFPRKFDKIASSFALLESFSSSCVFFLFSFHFGLRRFKCVLAAFSLSAFFSDSTRRHMRFFFKDSWKRFASKGRSFTLLRTDREVFTHFKRFKKSFWKHFKRLFSS